MFASHVRRLSFPAALFVLASVGCSQQISIPQTVPVRGMVASHQKPVPGVTVKFHPQFDMGRVKFIPNGETDREGMFTLSTGEGGNGAPLGDYVVTLEKLKVTHDPQQSSIEVEVDEWQGKYADPATSTWKVTVKDGTNDLKPFEID